MVSHSENGEGNGRGSLEGHPLARLPRDELDLVVEFVLRSGSLKDLASAYRVSYPTIRDRLDRVIERLKLAVAGKTPDPLHELLASLVERGELSVGGAWSIRERVRARDASRGSAGSSGQAGA